MVACPCHPRKLHTNVPPTQVARPDPRSRYSFKVDTEIGGAEWRHDVLYFGPTLFDQTNWSSSTGKLRTRLQLIDLDSKACFASILYHEYVHVVNNETWSVYRWNVTRIERRAWDAQIWWLSGVQQTYRNDRGSAQRIGYLIDRARDGRSRYD